MIRFYYGFSKMFNWTPDEIDEMEIEMAVGYMEVFLDDSEEKPVYIDQIM